MHSGALAFLQLPRCVNHCLGAYAAILLELTQLLQLSRRCCITQVPQARAAGASWERPADPHLGSDTAHISGKRSHSYSSTHPEMTPCTTQASLLVQKALQPAHSVAESPHAPTPITQNSRLQNKRSLACVHHLCHSERTDAGHLVLVGKMIPLAATLAGLELLLVVERGLCGGVPLVIIPLVIVPATLPHGMVRGTRLG